MNNTVKQLQDIIKNIPVRVATLPEDSSVHEVFVHEGVEGLRSRLNTYKGEYVEFEEVKKETKLEVIHEHKLRYTSAHFIYNILGSLSQDLGNMKVTLMVEDVATGRKERTKIDLYEPGDVQRFADHLGEYHNPEEIEAELNILTDLLEAYREAQLVDTKSALTKSYNYAPVPPERRKECIQFLSAPDLLKRIDELVCASGITGEGKARLLLFVIASTYKMSDPLHAIVQGSSGSGKTHLINGIASLMPQEDVISMTRITSKSLFHYNENELMNKLIVIQDYDGLDEQAEFAFRELQSAGRISSSTTFKDKKGNLVATVKTVKSHFASLIATTKGEVYTDNMSRSVLVGIDESTEQTGRIIGYQNSKLAGHIDARKEHEAKLFLQDCIRSLEPKTVVNPFADKISLPVQARMLRRLNTHYQAFVKAVTILHQHQREDQGGKIISTPEDLRIACELLFDSIMLKVDDLDASLRQFFEELKVYAKGTTQEFSLREIRLALKISKTQCFRYFEELVKLEYIRKSGGHVNKGFKYKIMQLDQMEALKAKIKQDLIDQLMDL